MAIIKDRAFVLKRIFFRNTSMIVDLFTASEGRLTVMAKGARKERSPFFGTLDYASCLEGVWIDRKSGMGILTESCIIDWYPQIHADAARLTRALMFTRIIREFLEDGHPEPELFSTVQLWFAGLNQVHSDCIDAHYIYGILQILDIAGFCPDLETCSLCGQPPKGPMNLIPAWDQIACNACTRAKNGKKSLELSVRCSNIIRFLQGASVYADLKSIAGSDMLECERFVTQFASLMVKRDIRAVTTESFYA